MRQRRWSYQLPRPRENSIRFTPVQVEAIRSGVNPGLTMVVGPPGTGKTDTAVQAWHRATGSQQACSVETWCTGQVVNLLFHNFPDQKIVLVAHSNQALNDLFEKIVALDIPERYLLRLGRGIEAPSLPFSFRYGHAEAAVVRSLSPAEGAGCKARLLQVGAGQPHADTASAPAVWCGSWPVVASISQLATAQPGQRFCLGRMPYPFASSLETRKRRIELLSKVERLADSLGLSGQDGATMLNAVN